MLEAHQWLSVALATLALYGTTVTADAFCVRGATWWDRQRGVCTPCTRCEPSQHLAVLTPCELHRDTTCTSIYELDIWPFAVTDNDTAVVQPSDYDYYGDEEASVVSAWDARSSTLTLAASGCVIFFVVVLALSLYHARQWRWLKQDLRTDVEELSAKLRLIEAGTTAKPVHHIYCNIHPTKEVLAAPTTPTKKGFGNVYTQEKHST